MIALFLFRFWPVLIPSALYALWWVFARKDKQDFRASHAYWLVLATLLTGAACFLVLGFSNNENKGEYIPPHMEHGKLIPSEVKP